MRMKENSEETVQHKVKNEPRPLSSASSSESLNSPAKSPRGTTSPVVATCNVCGKNFCSVGALKRHTLSIHLKNEIFPCTVADCGRSFLLKEYLKKHLRRFHKLAPMFPRKRRNCSNDNLSIFSFKTEEISPASSPEKYNAEASVLFSPTNLSQPLTVQTTLGQEHRTSILKSLDEAAKNRIKTLSSSSPDEKLSAKAVRINDSSNLSESFSPDNQSPIDMDLENIEESPEKGYKTKSLSEDNPEGGKGKRKKHKKTLVDGWVDPDELEDFWLPPDQVKKPKIQEKKKMEDKKVRLEETKFNPVDKKTPGRKKMINKWKKAEENRLGLFSEKRQDTNSPSLLPGSTGTSNGCYASKANKGPLIRIKGTSLHAPESVTILNGPECSSQANNAKLGKGRSFAGPFINEKIAKALYNRPPTHFVLNYEDTHNWRCMLCGHGNFFDDLGELFGPMMVTESKLNPIFKKAMLSLCRESETSMSESAVLSPRRSRIVSGTKTNTVGSKSPTRSAITSSGNIAQEDSSVVTNPDPEPYEIWLHELCAVWSVGVYMVEGKIYGLEEALNIAAETKCSLCLENGASLGCFKSCNSNYHYHCARKKDCQFNEENFTIRCPKHIDNKNDTLSILAQ